MSPTHSNSPQLPNCLESYMELPKTAFLAFSSKELRRIYKATYAQLQGCIQSVSILLAKWNLSTKSREYIFWVHLYLKTTDRIGVGNFIHSNKVKKFIPLVAVDWKYDLQVQDGSAKLHVISFSACYIDPPCGPNWSFPQVGTTDAELLCMETKPRKVFYDWLCQLVSVEENILS